MDLIEQYRLMHDAGHFPGHSLKKHVEPIKRLVVKTNSKTLLDYGCGKGLQYSEMNLHRYWNVRPALYDPAIWPEKPEGRFDGVICTDVMEHIPEEEIEDTLQEIFSYAEKFVFLSICTREAKKHLPDGRNCHLTVRPEFWWRTLIEGLEPSVMYEVEFVE